jgi:hypothetical protein
MKPHKRKNIDNGHSKPLYTLFQKEVSSSFQNKNTDLTAAVRKSQKGFNSPLREDKSVGYHITPHGFLISQKNKKKLVPAKAGSIENTKRRYTQFGHKSLQMYPVSSTGTSLKCWRAWAYAHLLLQVHSVGDIICSLLDKGTSSRESTKFTEIKKTSQISLGLTG